jgi:2-dehydro-3-deoxygalactonokinase
MTPAPIGRAVALDGGTSTTRARLVEGDRVIAVARRAVGVRDAVRGDGRGALAAAAREAIDEVLRAAGGPGPDLIVASGMLSSEVGLAAVPHVIAPAGPDELARGVVACEIPEVADRPILFVPGVRTPPAEGPDGWAEADVMRGEECETLGALHLLFPPSSSPDPPSPTRAFVWPGSHTKLVEVDGEGRIVRSQTTLAGELTQALARHTLLAASLPEALPEEPDPEALEAGARLVAREGLGRAAFLVRVAALSGALDPPRRASFWVGAVVADDVAHLARHPILHGRRCEVWVGGRQPQRSLYARWLAPRHGGPVAALDGDHAEGAAAVGAVTVARRHLEFGGPEGLLTTPRTGSTTRRPGR